MFKKQKASLEERIQRAAERSVAEQDFVSPVEVMTRIGWLAPSNVQAWRLSRVPCLQEVTNCTPETVARGLAILQRWAEQKGLKALEVDYLARSRNTQTPLRFTATADPDTERIFRTHYVSTDLTPKASERLEKKLTKSPDLVVFEITRDSECSECHAELGAGSLLFMELDRPLCMECADFDELTFLFRGDAALSRRARKYSPLSAIVVRFSRARRRYERQGILVTEEALARAEAECLADADLRARRRERAALRSGEQDERLTSAMGDRILELFPGCPRPEAQRIAAHATVRGSGRVGRSADGRALDDHAVTLAVIASIRHHHTPYDRLLMSGTARRDARSIVQEEIEEVLERWRQ